MSIFFNNNSPVWTNLSQSVRQPKDTADDIIEKKVTEQETNKEQNQPTTPEKPIISWDKIDYRIFHNL